MIENGFVENRKDQNLKPLKINDKEKYYYDLLNIEHSWSGRMDVSESGNIFIMEAEQSLINAIELFELGYFDCAYYSLRSAIDISTTMVFLSDLSWEEREKFLKNWKETKDFPMQGQMIKELSKNGNIFMDMKKAMPTFFEDSKILSADLNKYVHKQGFQHFYVSRNHILNNNKNYNKFIEKFEYYLKKCIGVVAVMRLAIDPFPILLMDKDILYRCFDSMTDPYSQEFVDEYIGNIYINEYKTTDFYFHTYNSFKEEPLKKEATFNVLKHQYIDTTKKEDLMSQLTLLDKYDRVSVLLAFASDKIVKVYCCGGLMMYFTDKNTNRKTLSWSSEDFDRFKAAEIKINNSYDEVYISVFNFNGETYWVEHNIKIETYEYNEIEKFVNSENS